VVDYGTGGSMRWKYGITSDMGGKTGTTNDNTDGWFMGYTPQILAGAWVGCDDPFLHLRNGWTNGGNDMAMPEWAYFMQKVYADKKLGIDPKAVFQKPAELNNDPIFADQNFSNLVKEGQGNDIEDNGNGDAGDYEATTPNIPVESEFNKAPAKDNSSTSTEKKVVGPINMADEFKKDTSKAHPKTGDEKNIDNKLNKGAEDKSKKQGAKPVKPASDY
jgi:penicillin-binding protein 1A